MTTKELRIKYELLEAMYLEMKEEIKQLTNEIEKLKLNRNQE